MLMPYPYPWVLDDTIASTELMEAAGAELRASWDRTVAAERRAVLAEAEADRLRTALASIQPRTREERWCKAEGCKGGTAMPGVEARGLCWWCWTGEERVEKS